MSEMAQHLYLDIFPKYLPSVSNKMADYYRCKNWSRVIEWFWMFVPDKLGKIKQTNIGGREKEKGEREIEKGVWAVKLTGANLVWWFAVLVERNRNGATVCWQIEPEKWPVWVSAENMTAKTFMTFAHFSSFIKARKNWRKRGFILVV